MHVFSRKAVLLINVQGAIGSITSAITVAASSFEMTITDPTVLLNEIDEDRLQDILGTEWTLVDSSLQYVEPPAIELPAGLTKTAVASQSSVTSAEQMKHRSITGKVQTLGDFIDTDALAPAEALLGHLSAEEMGNYCLYHTHPNFRRDVKQGSNVVVAGKAFGVGSSRENAVTALMGAGVQCVIAKSFAFIYARNQPNLGLLGIVMKNDEFYKLAVNGAKIEIFIDERTVKIGNQSFDFTLSELEVRLWEQGGMSAAFARWGKNMLKEVTAPSRSLINKTTPAHEELSW